MCCAEGAGFAHSPHARPLMYYAALARGAELLTAFTAPLLTDL